MGRQELRTKEGKLLGTISENNSGKEEVRNRNNELLATYNPDTNETRDKYGHLIGKGDFLSSFIR